MNERLAQHVQNLHSDGMNGTQIANALGYSRSYIASIINDPTGEKNRERRKRYQKPCPQCGTLMDGSNGLGPDAPKLCQRCSTQAAKDNRYWTRERIIESIQRYAALYGQPPRSIPDFLSPQLHQDNQGLFDTPGFSSVYKYRNNNNPFGSWADAIEAAGFPRPRVGHHSRTGEKGLGKHSRQILEILRKNNGPVPTWYLADSTGLPSSKIWSAARNLTRRGLITQPKPGHWAAR